MNMLSPHFAYEELTTTHQKLPNRPGAEELANLICLCELVLEPIRMLCGPLRINSGYRSPEVNAAIGGTPKSQHMRGEAADLAPLARDVSVNEAYRKVVEKSGILFDQAILYPDRFIHVSCAPHREPRRQALVCSVGADGHKQYGLYKQGELT